MKELLVVLFLLVAPMDQERPPRRKNLPANKEWNCNAAVPTDASTSSLSHACALSAHTRMFSLDYKGIKVNHLLPPPAAFVLLVLPCRSLVAAASAMQRTPGTLLPAAAAPAAPLAAILLAA